jgi:hypothetical protein
MTFTNPLIHNLNPENSSGKIIHIHVHGHSGSFTSID